MPPTPRPPETLPYTIIVAVRNRIDSISQRESISRPKHDLFKKKNEKKNDEEINFLETKTEFLI